uniref:DUF4283 domain-containing protein n=1 Tax=Setaria viridis TaxID=4556 RepID=A0A4U6T688_SETVI|nr:hypothetical protein SEVIR_9G483300v2 [Setaria viridis]
MAIGDPHTRPEVKTIFVSDSFHLEHDAREWEACALVPWALHLPSGAGARDIAGLISRELRLRPGEVSVTLHQPEPYLIHFDSTTQAAEARRRGRFTGGGIDICLRPWRSLTHSLGFRIFYRVRLCLDGIPRHAWTPEIVERVIGHKCTLQHIVTDLIQPADSRHIELWAWTVDPSEIPKKIWLAFAHSPQGARYEIFIHMPLLEDYTAAARNLQQAVDAPENITPIRRRYEWRYGLVDGAPSDARSCFPARLPKPPREPAPRIHDDHGDRRREDQRRGKSGASAAGGVGGRGASGEADVDAGGHGRGHHVRQNDRDRPKLRPTRQSCKGDFIWPDKRRGDDDDNDDDDYNHPGHGRKFGDAYWGCADAGRRDRTRSPPRRSYAPPQGRQQTTGIQEQSTLPASNLRALFQAQMSTLRHNSKVTSPFNRVDLEDREGSLHDDGYAGRISWIADRLSFDDSAPGEKAWSASIPLPRVFNTLRAALLPATSSTRAAPLPATASPTVADVERALDAMTVGIKQITMGQTDSPTLERQPAGPAVRGLPLPGRRLSTMGPNMCGSDGPTPPGDTVHGSPTPGRRPTTPTQMTTPDGPTAQDILSVPMTGPPAHAVFSANAADRQIGPAASGLPGHLGQPSPPTRQREEDLDLLEITSLFRTPTPPLIQAPEPRRQRQRRTFDMKAVRRSARLARKPSISVTEKAQRNLCRKLGLTPEETAPVDEVLRDFLSSFHGPIPETIVAALTAIFGLDDEGADMLDEALLTHAGTAVADLQQLNGDPAI